MSKEVGMSSKKRGKGGAPSRTQGARRATGERDGGGALTPGQRWRAGRKREVVLRLLAEIHWMRCCVNSASRCIGSSSGVTRPCRGWIWV